MFTTLHHFVETVQSLELRLYLNQFIEQFIRLKGFEIQSTIKYSHLLIASSEF